jgi:hypothetical protein
MSKHQVKIESKNEFLKFLDAVSIINEACILSIQSNVCSVLSIVPDETLYILGEYKGVTSEQNCNLNIPNLKKLSRVLEDVSEQEIEFEVDGNSISYCDNSVKFRYHLYDDNFLAKPKVKAEKIKAFKYDTEFTLPKTALPAIVKGSSFAQGCRKVYLYTEGNLLKAEMTDKEKRNTDSLALTLGEVDFELAPIILNLDNLKLIYSVGGELNVKINSDLGVTAIDSTSNSTYLRYILTSLV